MTHDSWYIVGAVLTLVGAYLAAKVAGRATVNAAKVSADEGAFVRATEIYEKGQEEFEGRLNRLRDDLTAALADLAQTKKDLADARAEIRTLRRSVSQYEGRVIQLTEVLRLHDITVPPWTLNPSDYGMLPGSLPDPNQPPQTTETA